MEDTVSKNDRNTKVKKKKEKMADWINDFKMDALVKIQRFETELVSITKERTKLNNDLKSANEQLINLSDARKSLDIELKRLNNSLESSQSELKYS